jgi:hypothetical protein
MKEIAEKINSLFVNFKTVETFSSDSLKETLVGLES